MPPHGVKEATTNPQIIERWFREDPDANIGVAAGSVADLLVLDIDPRNGGTENLGAVCREIGDLPPTVTARTGGGGQHLFFRYPNVSIRKDSAGKRVGLGVDIVSNGAFVVMPGSEHSSGRRYSWAKGRGPRALELASLPDAWVHLLSGSDPTSKVAAAPQTDKTAPNVGSVIPEGQRNDALTSRAGALHRRGCTASEILSVLQAINEASCQPPLADDEVRGIVNSVVQYPIAPNTASTGDHAELLMHATLAAHFASGEHLLFGIDGQFWSYSGRIWVGTGEHLIRQSVLETARSTSARTSQSMDGLIKQVVSLMRAHLASSDDKLRLNGEPPPVINCRNGELWIGEDGSLELRAHDYRSYLRHCINADYAPDASCPRYDRAVATIFSKADAPKDVVRHWHELAGYMLQPRRPISLILILQGGGSNGKTALMQLFGQLMGSELISRQAIGSLDSSRFAFTSLVGKLLLIDDDVKAGARLPDGELKKISEAKSITAERKFGPTFNFVCLTVPVLLCNNVMSLADVSVGMRRRLMVVPFEHTFTSKDRDPDLFKQIEMTEMSGVLNRCIKGLQRVIGRRYVFKEPKAVAAATRQWVCHANPLPAFIEECCVRDAGSSELALTLYREYNNWAEGAGITLRQQQQSFYRNVEHLDFATCKRNRGLTFIGLRLKSSV